MILYGSSNLDRVVRFMIMRLTEEEILLFILNKINGYIRKYDKCNDKRYTKTQLTLNGIRTRFSEIDSNQIILANIHLQNHVI